MTGNQVVSTMFDVRTSIHMDRIVSFGDWNEYLEWLGFIFLIIFYDFLMEDNLEL